MCSDQPHRLAPDPFAPDPSAPAPFTPDPFAPDALGLQSSSASWVVELNYGWYGSIAQFLTDSASDWLTTIATHYQTLYHQRATATQQQAWLDCYHVLRSSCLALIQQRSISQAWTLIFEYELPREGGRRPDLVILAAGHILVVEFKQKRSPSAADLDQVAAYARDLAEYHSGSHHRPVTAILVPTRCPDLAVAGAPYPTTERQNVRILPPSEITAFLIDLEEQDSPIDPEAWLKADYAPLPTIVQAARQIFQHEPLPEIRRAQSAGIPDLLERLDRLVDTAQAQHERHLVLVTGVPGSGKTLVGLQLVYQNHRPEAKTQQAVFLSGNHPLVTVLQYALKSRVFVQEARNFYIAHQVRRQKAPKEHIIVFDEAQRAWDAERMMDKYGIEQAAAGTVLQIAERAPNWSVLVGLIGEGQQIHVGEEDGIEQWNQGLAQASTSWHVHCPPEQAHHFTAIDSQHLHSSPSFNLTTSLRTHVADNLQTWVAHVLSGRFDQAADLMPTLTADGFQSYLTRDLDFTKTYCRDRYSSQLNQRYGLLASSRSRNLKPYGVNNDYMATQKVKIGPWYIDPPNSPLSCCALTEVVTEFGCQGLELDWPIVCWGDDLLWCNATWSTSTRQRNVRDPKRLRLNSYRVLLTRGRDGFVVFVPPDAKMDSTYEGLRSAGLPLLPG